MCYYNAFLKTLQPTGSLCVAEKQRLFYRQKSPASETVLLGVNVRTQFTAG